MRRRKCTDTVDLPTGAESRAAQERGTWRASIKWGLPWCLAGAIVGAGFLVMETAHKVQLREQGVTYEHRA